MKKMILISIMVSAVFAGGLQSQAEAMGSARAIALYWGEHTKDDDAAKQKCEEYAKSQYATQNEQNTCVSACVDNFKNIADKNGR